MKRNVICYPRGSGGNWLHNLIWRLEISQFDLPNVDVVFDGQPTSANFLRSHIFDLFDGKNATFDECCKGNNLIKFSSPCWFNQFINDAVKIRYRVFNLSDQSIVDQFFTLTDSAVYILTDLLWQKTWEQPGELDYRLLIEDPDQFIDRLFSVLDRCGIKYTRNRSYCHSSIEYYKSTCPNPSEHLNNFNSLLWLAWCHAHISINNQFLPATIPSNATVDAIRNIVEPASAGVLARTLPMVARYEYST